MTIPLRFRTTIRRTVFVGFNLGLVCLAWALVLHPIASHLQDQAIRLRLARLQLRDYEAIASEDKATRAAASASEGMPGPLQAAALADADEGSAEADLMTRLRGRVEPSGARIQAIRILGRSTIDGVAMLGAHVDLSGDNASVATALEGLERGTPMVVIDDAVVRSTAPPTARAPDTNPEIEARLDVFAPWHGLNNAP